MRKTIFKGLLGLSLAMPLTAAVAQELTIYSGRGETFVTPIFKMFEKETGVKLKVRYGSTAELATLLQEEGAKTPADVFWAQDGSALGATADLFAPLPAKVYEGQSALFKNAAGKWVGVSGRSRSLVYSPKRVSKDTLPQSVFDLTDAKWKGRVGWSPVNASFQAFITAMRVKDGEEKAKVWVAAMVANGAKSYKNNTALVQAIADGEIDAALVNTYYLSRFKIADEKFPVEQTFFTKGDIGNLLNVSGVGILKASVRKKEAQQFVDFLLSPRIQQYFTSAGAEYPVVSGVIVNSSLANVADPAAASPEIPLDKLSDMKGTQAILVGAGLF